MLSLLLATLMALPGGQDLTIEPSPPVAGKAVVVTKDRRLAADTVHLSSPLGGWRRIYQATEVVAATLPDDIPLLIAFSEKAELERSAVEFWTVHLPDGRAAPRSFFWRAYLLAGLPAPFPLPGADIKAATDAAVQAAQAEPGYLPARELMWLLRSKTTGDALALLKELDDETARIGGGRAALGAVRIHRSLGDGAGAQALAETYAAKIADVRKSEARRWAEIIDARDFSERIRLLHEWMATDPFSEYFPQCLQILAATYAARGDYLSTARFGLMSLELSPDDAMTLNGVALAMAEGEFSLERGLGLAGRALGILRNPQMLKRPEQLSELRWQAELEHAQAACLDTQGWLLTKLERWEEAERALQSALDLEKNEEFYLHYGLMLSEKGDKDKARKVLRTGLKISSQLRGRIEAALAALK